MLNKVLTPVLIALLFAGASYSQPGPHSDPVPQEEEHPFCATNPTTLPIVAAKHEAFKRHRERQREAGVISKMGSGPNVFRSGNIAVFEDDGTIVIPPQEFDLQGKAIQYLKRPKGVSAVRSALTFKSLIGDKIPLGDNQSVKIDFPEGFTYPFGDGVYTSLWLNANGSITFGSPEPFQNPSLNAFLFGPPRLAPLYTGLALSAATGENGIYVSFPPNRVRITWLGVPEAGIIQNLSTFQVTLFETGRVNFAYGDTVDASSPVVGISPYGDTSLHLMNYNEELPFRPQRTAIAEAFTEDSGFDDFAVAQTFYQHFRDEYTFLITFLDYRFALGNGAFAFELTVNNTTLGAGEGLFNFASALGSDGTLQSYIQMGSLVRYPDNLDTPFLRTSTAMGVLGHEVGHRWLSRARFVDDNGNLRSDLLRPDGSHYSYFTDADGSFMEGNDWQDVGGGLFRTTDRTTSHYSDLDQYFMGFIPPSQVNDFFYITNANAGTSSDPTAVGAERTGTRVDVTFDQVLSAMGRRVPNSANAPKRFRMAFVLVGRNGEPVSQASIDKLEAIRSRWPSFFAQATDNRGEANTVLLPR